MKEKFYQWMGKHENKKPNTAYAYKNSIDKISKHYSENDGNKIDIYYIKDIRLLESIAYDYSKKGKYSSFGDGGNGTIRNAISTYVRFSKNKEGNDISDFVNNYTDYKEPMEFTNEVIEEEGSDEIAFAYERDLQKSLISQVSLLFPDYKIFGEHKEGIEYLIETKRIDLLLEKKIDKSLLAIELKSGLADYKTFGQLSLYIGLLMKSFPGRKISGIIIAGEIDQTLQVASLTNHLIALKTYKMNITLNDANSG